MNIIKTILDSSKGKFLTVTFLKKDGTVRVINGRSGVKKYLAGGVRTTDPKEYFIIHENGNPAGDAGYRAIAYDRVLEIAMEGKKLFVAPKEVGK